MSILHQYLPELVVVACLLLAERIARAPDRDTWINLLAWMLNLAAGYTVYRLVTAWNGPALIDGASLPAWLAVVIFVLVNDLGEYVFHRMQHAIPLLWSMHSLHHSDPEMSALTTNRHYWADRAFKTITVWSLSAMIISATRPAIAIYVLLSFWNYFVHARLPVDFGRWSWVVNSPAYHRRHHSSLPEHYDSNFAALFPIWDVLSGAYHRPEGFPPTGFDARPHNLLELIAWPLYYDRGAASPSPDTASPAQ